MTIAKRITYIQELIKQTAHRYHRDPEVVRLLAVSKGQSCNAIKEAYAAGVTEFGESYWQEAKAKMLALQKLPLTWHFIGPIQSNKAIEITQHFSWVHSIDREKIAHLLSTHRPKHLEPLNVCIQINLEAEPSKSGIKPQELAQLARLVNQLPGLKLRGLMAIPKPCSNAEIQYHNFLRLAHLLKSTNQDISANLDTLSMGMSEDFEAAIHAGSTLLRIGRAIFGERY